MPKSLTGNPALFPAQTSPVAGEPRTSGSIETPLQNAADRAQFVYDRMMFVDPTRDGVRRLRRFATLADMKAEADLTDGGVALVDGVGLYEYRAASTASELSPVAIKPASVGGGPGAWLVAGVGSGMLNVPNGVPQLDGAAKVPTSRLAASDTDGRIVASAVRNGIVTTSLVSVQDAYTSSTTYADVPGMAFSLTMKVGDRAIVVGQASQFNDENMASVHRTIWGVTPPSLAFTTIQATERRRVDPGGTSGFLSLGLPIGFGYVAAVDGVHAFKMQHKTDNGWLVALENIFAIAIQVRP